MPADDPAGKLAAELEAVTLNDSDMPTGHVSTGCLALDALLLGGVPLGLITEVVGDFSTGKSLMGLQLCREAINLGGVGVYLDAENALNREWATATLGVKAEGLIYNAVETLEAGYAFIQSVLRSKAVQRVKPVIIVWDSIGGTPPKAVLEQDGNSRMAAAARVNSENMPAILGGIRKAGVSLVLLNQLRSKIGVMFGQRS